MLKRLLPLLLIPIAFSTNAGTPEEKGLAIAIESDRRDQGYGDFSVDLEMVLKNRHGEESRRKIRVATLEGKSDGDKSHTLFNEPADVKGTALLTFSHKADDDDQWLYLPALKRVKRITSSNKSGSFMGSEFAFEDIGSQEVEKYTYKFLREEACEGQTCLVLERYPVSTYSGYTRQVMWMDKAEYRPQRIDFYDRKSSLLKTLTWKGYQRYLNKHWRADEMFMLNHQSGKSTLLRWTNFKFGNGLKDADFNQERLKRGH
jgi:outer membrane lipoprotein-sorting protein